MEKQKKWWEEGEFFGEDYLQLYEPKLTKERTLKEVEGLGWMLELKKGDKILDLCCGHGRHAIELAKRGYNVTGLDINRLFLERANKEASRQKVNVDFIQGDMREIPFIEQFDAVINMFTSFGYFEKKIDNLLVLKEISGALKAGGKFLIQVMSKDWLIRNFRERDWREGKNGLLCLEEREFDFETGRNNAREILIYPDGARKEKHLSLRVYDLSGFKGMLDGTGLNIQRVYGNFDRGNHNWDSRDMIIVAKKG